MKKETKETPKDEAPASQATLDKLDAVRNLLFGEMDQEYRGEFQGLKKVMEANFQRTDSESEKLKKDLLERLDQLEARLTTRMDEGMATLAARIDALEKSTVPRKQLSQLLQDIAQSLDS